MSRSYYNLRSPLLGKKSSIKTSLEYFIARKVKKYELIRQITKYHTGMEAESLQVGLS